MSGDGDWPLQQAVFGALSGDPQIISLLGTPPRILDDAPEETIFPYLIIGQSRLNDWRGVEKGVEHDIRLYAWSRYGGRKELKDIISAVYDVLHEANLSVTGRMLVNLRFVFADIFRKQDGDTYQGVMRYRAVTEPV